MFASSGASRDAIPLLEHRPQLQTDYLHLPVSDNEASVSGDSLSGISDPNETSNDSSALYARLPLHSHTATRVLDLHGAFESEDEPIMATMRVVDLDERPFFTALSYVWGEWSETKYEVHCNGYPIPVTENCWAALRRLRKIGVTTIWVDAVCINQNDDNDKSSQLPLMGRIYSSTGAHAIYVWLGEGTKDTDQAMDYLARGCLPFSFLIFQKIRDDRNGGNGIPTGFSMSLRLGVHLYFRLIYIRYKPHFKGIEHLFSHPWIERLWTLQEALLSDKLIIVCGKKTVSFQALVYSVQFMDIFREKPLGIRFPAAFLRWRQLIRLWVDLAELEADDAMIKKFRRGLREHRQHLRTGWTVFKVIFFIHIGMLLGSYIALIFFAVFLEQIPQRAKEVLPPIFIVVSCGLIICLLPMVFTRGIRKQHESIYPYTEDEALFLEIQGRQSKYPKDRYFATFSLLRRGNEETESPADLNSSRRTLYRLLCKDLLKFTRNLDFLLLTSNEKLEGCPSWVVNWPSAQICWMKALFVPRWPQGRINNLLSRFGFSTFAGTVYRRCGATLESSSKWKIRNKTQLVVQGAVIGRISWCSAKIDRLSDSPSPEELRSSVAQLLEGFSHLDRIVYSLEPSWSTLAKIDNVTRTVTHREEFHDDGDGHAQWCCIMNSGLTQGPEWTQRELERQSIPPTGWKWLLTSISRKVQSQKVKTVLDFHQWLTTHLNDGRMALAVCEGDYSEGGVVPCDARIGDVLVLIKGVSLAMILRQHDQGYEVVGPALFDVSTNGTVWESLEPERLHEIVLI